MANNIIVVKKIILKKNWRYALYTKGVNVYSLTTGRQFLFAGNQAELIFILKELRVGIEKNRLIKKAIENRIDPELVKKVVMSVKKINSTEKTFTNRNSLSKSYLLGLDRQINFFKEIYPTINPYKIQKKIKDIKIAVLGAGSVGNQIIPSLINAGIGNFLLVDFDRVEERNLGRQFLFNKGDIGKFKVDVIRKMVGRIKSGINIKINHQKLKDVNQIKKIIKDSDIIIQCCDSPRFLIHNLITKACLDLKKPNIVATSGRVGPFCIPYKTACYGCYELEYKNNFPAYDSMVKEVQYEEEIRLPGAEIANSLIGAIVSREVINHILKLKPETYNSIIVIEIPCLKISNIRIKRKHNCPICGDKYNGA